jgi:hypothetical protein
MAAIARRRPAILGTSLRPPPAGVGRSGGDMPADRDYLEEDKADESEYGSLVVGLDAERRESADEAPGSCWSSGELRRRMLVLLLAALLFFRWQATPPPQSKFAQCHSTGPVLVGSHHKTGTVLLTHLLKDACYSMDWRCVFNHDRGHCASVAEAKALGADLCLLQHGVQFKGLVPATDSQHAPPAVVAIPRSGSAGSTHGSAAAQPPGRALGDSSSGSGAADPFDPNYRFVHAIRDPLEVFSPAPSTSMHRLPFPPPPTRLAPFRDNTATRTFPKTLPRLPPKSFSPGPFPALPPRPFAAYAHIPPNPFASFLSCPFPPTPSPPPSHVPLQVVLSGYSYHLRTTERWANRAEKRWNGTTYRFYLNALSVEEGLRAEVRHSARDNLKTMPRLFDRTAHRACTLTVRFEDFATDWEGTLGGLWDLMGVTAPADLKRLARVSEKHNVYRHNNTRGSHVSLASSDRRAAMRELLRRSPDAMERIRSVRRKLGYPLVGLEGNG